MAKLKWGRNYYPQEVYFSNFTKFRSTQVNFVVLPHKICAYA